MFLPCLRHGRRASVELCILYYYTSLLCIQISLMFKHKSKRYKNLCSQTLQRCHLGFSHTRSHLTCTYPIYVHLPSRPPIYVQLIYVDITPQVESFYHRLSLTTAHYFKLFNQCRKSNVSPITAPAECTSKCVCFFLSLDDPPE